MRTRVATGARLFLIPLFLSSGVLHFLTPGVFLAIVPPALPRPDLLVAISGAAEIAGALGLGLPATRRAASWGLIALLLAVFPANIQMLWNAIQSGASAGWLALLWLRLPIQPLLIWLAWRAGRDARAAV